MIVRHPLDLGSRVITLCDCPLCGWQHVEDWGQEVIFTSGETRAQYRALEEFDVNSPHLALAELGTHLKRNVSDIYALGWRRFEEIVNDVLSRNGFQTVLTQPTRDNAADILILSKDSKVDAIVECKKINRGRKLNVNVVRTLIGAAVDWDVRKVWLVTTGGLTRPATQRVDIYRKRGFEFEIVKAQELLDLLGVYNEAMPLLPNLSDEVKAQIIKTNTEALNAEKHNGWPNGYPRLF